MFVLAAVILGLLIGLIRGGHASGLRSKKLSLWPLGLVGVILQLLLHLYFYTGGIASIDAILPIFNFVSYILILVTLIFNLDDFWTILMAVGTTANFVVTFINGGRVPVAQSIVDALSGSALAQSISGGTSAVYSVISQSTTTLWFLGINIPVPFVGRITALYGGVPGFSVGSALIFVGILGWIQYMMHRVSERSAFRDDAYGTKDYILPPEGSDAADDGLLADTGEDTMSRGLFGKSKRSKKMDDLFDDDGDDMFRDDAGDEDEGEEAGSLFEPSDTRKNVNTLFEQDSLFDVPKDSTEELTEIIPKLTPEAMEEIRRHAADGMTETGSAAASSDTRVFTALNNLGAIDAADTKPGIVAFEEPKEPEEAEDSGFFTQSFYAEKGKSPAAEAPAPAVEVPEIPEVPEEEPVRPVQAGQPVVFDEEPEEKEPAPVKQTQWDPHQVQRSTYSNYRSGSYHGTNARNNPYSTKFAMGQTNYDKGDEDDMGNKRSEEEMMNIWHQVVTENEQKRHRSRSKYGEGTNPFRLDAENRERIAEEKRSEERDRQIAEMKAKAAREKMARKWDEGMPVNKATTREMPQISTKPAAAAATPQPAPAAAAPKAKSATDEERERAGFEKVEIEIDGRKVSFWRKKKA